MRVGWKEGQEGKAVEEGGNAVLEGVTGIVLRRPEKAMQIRSRLHDIRSRHIPEKP